MQMKKLAIGALSALALAFAFTPASAADPINDFCKANNELGLSNHGECVTLLKGKSNNLPPTLCKYLKENYAAIFDANFKNQGDCVSYFRTL